VTRITGKSDECRTAGIDEVAQIVRLVEIQVRQRTWQKLALWVNRTVDESNRMLHKFFFFTDGPFKSKSAVFFRHEDGKRLAFFTFASSYEEAVLFAKAAYPYPN
jgi:hypothetical protein